MCFRASNFSVIRVEERSNVQLELEGCFFAIDERSNVLVFPRVDSDVSGLHPERTPASWFMRPEELLVLRTLQLEAEVQLTIFAYSLVE